MASVIGGAKEDRIASSVSAVLAFGSNLGDRAVTITQAVDEVRTLDGVAVDAVSDLIETPAVTLDGVSRDEPAYLNLVVTVRTSLTPPELLRAVNGIENAHGRVRRGRWGNRTLDIDIVTFDELERSDAQLTLPHPRAWTRGFVLVPWLQIDPEAVLPGRGRVADLVNGVTDTVVFYSNSENGLRS